jgi:O-antigen/teichoic acid export membrane protein
MPVIAAPPEPAADGRGLGLAAVPAGGARSAFSDAATLTLATYGAQALLFAAGFAQKGLMGPVNTGFWSLIQTIWVFLTIAPLGTMHGATRQIPLRRGRGDFAAAAAAAGTGSSFSLLTIAVAGGLLAVVAALLGGAWSPQMRWGLVILGLSAPLWLLCDCHQVIFQATRRFDAAALSVLLDALVTVTLGTLLVWLLGFYGMFAAALVSNVVLLTAWMRGGLTGLRRPAFSWGIERRLVRELVTFGAPIMIQGQIWLLFLTVDNLIVAGVLGVRDLGYYALAVSVTSYVLFLPRSIGAALFPRMTERFAATGDIASIRHYATDVQRLLAYVLLPIFVAAAYFGVPVLIRHGLPAFEPAIDAVRIMVAGSFAVALVNMPTKLLITAGCRWPLVALMLGCLALNGAANAIAIGPLGLGIDGAAVATSLSYLVTFAVLSTYALRRALDGRSVGRHLGELVAVLGYVLAALWGVEWVVGHSASTLPADVALAALKMAAFLALLTPCVLWAQERHGTVTALRSLARAVAVREGR